MGRIVTCGVCGFIFEEGELQQEAKHAAEHQKHSSCRFELPPFVRDMIRYWADQKLRTNPKGLTPQELEEVDVSRWVLMHMWHNQYGSQWVSEDEAFVKYEADIRKMYPNLRNLPSRFVKEFHDSAKR